MSSLNEHVERWRSHQQPRRVDYTRPGFVRPADPCEECGGTGRTPEDDLCPCRGKDLR